ncbi:MAG TPA: zinc-binding alcohol dehydrogenase, partial [Labilithrix sp.]|nr:zinc-binding alcohol dehydrogenase [Labilithrix sp.]
ILASNLETAVNAVWDAGVQVGDRVLVVGFGTIGALVCHVLSGIAGVDLTVVDVSEQKLALAKAMGFRALSTDEWRPNSASPADVAFHASATSAGLQTALDAIGFEGQVVELCWFGTRDVTIRLGAGFHCRRQRIICSQVSSIAPRQRARWDYRRRKELVFRLLADPRFDACITHESAFSDLPSVYERLDAIAREGLYCAVRYSSAHESSSVGLPA